ncbi:MAG: hypothetical protein FRX49_09113 [Trebouxia sp. A1-2]|nr:MAG: hypothetical protein FRX49_09113 [Trebouxia sp. A1-2]
MSRFQKNVQDKVAVEAPLNGPMVPVEIPGPLQTVLKALPRPPWFKRQKGHPEQALNYQHP